eukprot:scaffold22029_cov62-Phaeocystis_antarctica.AAC.1
MMRTGSLPASFVRYAKVWPPHTHVLAACEWAFTAVMGTGKILSNPGRGAIRTQPLNAFSCRSVEWSNGELCRVICWRARRSSCRENRKGAGRRVLPRAQRSFGG